MCKCFYCWPLDNQWKWMINILSISISFHPAKNHEKMNMIYRKCKKHFLSCSRTIAIRLEYKILYCSSGSQKVLSWVRPSLSLYSYFLLTVATKVFFYFITKLIWIVDVINIKLKLKCKPIKNGNSKVVNLFLLAFALLSITLW